ncbi:MAG: flagellar hook-basal body complex protein [Campylobacterota bacterium]|nr:flagellar hook-basal body complex protein [Campylobacterota bacterium]
MMTQAFYSGISGIRTHSMGIDAVSDNLANISTIGYRGYNMEFAPLFENMINSASTTTLDSSIGVGTRVQATSMINSNGSLMLTDRSTDLAIDGDGWFGVQKDNEPVYTRDGSFTFDANDDLVTVDGFHVLGTMGTNINGETLSAVVDEIPLGNLNAQEKLRFPKSLTYPPEATSNASFYANLGVDPELRTIGAAVVDPQGVKNHLRLAFTKDPLQNPPGSQWNVTATTQTLEGDVIYDTQTGRVEFDAAGGLISSTLTSIDNNGASVAMDLGLGFSGIVAINIPVVSGSSQADGTIGGDLMGYEINENAEVIATFTNGMQSSVGKIAIFHFQNDQGLERISGSRFAEGSNSGEPIFFSDENGQNIIGSSVVNFKLEGSNYEMTSGLTELIILQRAFDANSKSIATADEMMQKALNMDA